jgi:hypothetical protein
MNDIAEKPQLHLQNVMRSAVKVDFSKLIGNKYPLETKMAILDWMLKTGKGHDHQYGWNRDGINKSILDYSANNHDTPVCLPKDENYSLFFDALFARAVYATANKPLNEWREKESIKPDKYRMLKFNDAVPVCEQKHFSWIIGDIFKFEGKLLKKELHHPEYLTRTEPKILWIAIYTTGNGWIVQYQFSFKEFDYEPGWTNGYHQNGNESIWEFLKRSYDELCTVVADA